MYFESWKYMFLRCSLASLARAVYVHFLSVHLGVLPPPPHTKKLATLVTTHTFPLGTGVRVGGGGPWGVPGTSTSKQAPQNKKQQVRPIHHNTLRKRQKQSKDSNGDGIHGNEPQPAEAETEYGQDHSESSAHAKREFCACKFWRQVWRVVRQNRSPRPQPRF